MAPCEVRDSSACGSEVFHASASTYVAAAEASPAGAAPRSDASSAHAFDSAARSKRPSAPRAPATAPRPPLARGPHSSATVGPASPSGSVRHGRHGQPRSTTHRPDAVPYAANAPPCDTATGPVGEASWRAQKSWTGRGVARASSKEVWRETGMLRKFLACVRALLGGRGGGQRAPRRQGAAGGSAARRARSTSRERAVKDAV